MRTFFLILVLINLGYYLISFTKGSAGISGHDSSNIGLITGIEHLQALDDIPAYGIHYANRSRSIIRSVKSNETAITTNSNVDHPESLSSKKQNLSQIHSSNTSQVSATATKMACYTFGPISSKKWLNKLEKNLGVKANGIKIRKVSNKEISAYWVYLNSYKHINEAKVIANKLKLDHVKQYYIVPSGQYKNAISLGLFKDRIDAQRRLQQIHEIGFPASIMTQYSTRTYYWIDFDQTNALEMRGTIKLAQLDSSDHLRQVQRVCPTGTK